MPVLAFWCDPIREPSNMLENQIATDCYLARVGYFGQVGRFRLTDDFDFSRGARAVCRTSRGIEVAQILAPTSHNHLSDGTILRKMTPEDHFLWAHLQKLASEAHASCQKWLKQNGVSEILIDVEPLLDGRTLYFHFLSEVPPSIQTTLDGLVATYERQVRESKFAQLLEHGCGPGCGTEEAENGCSTKRGCAVCQIASHCKK